MKIFNIVLIIFIILSGGCNVNSSQKTYDDETSEKAKSIVKSYLINNYHGIEDIELGELYQSPMGSMTVDGKVNGNEKFSITFTDKLKVRSLVVKSENFPEEKEECKEKDCDY